LLLIVSVGTVMAYNADYSIIEYWEVNPSTIDGKWTDADEWHDVTVQYMPSSSGHVALFEYKMLSDYSTFNMRYLIEFADSTNDPGDVFQICVGTASEATAPTENDMKFEYTGHTTLKTYLGTGTTWSLTDNPATYEVKDSLTASPHDPANHYVFEFSFDKYVYGWGSVAPPDGLRIACYDASNPGQGWIAWPPTSTPDNPNSWGAIADYSTEAAPEGLTIGVMLLTSSVVMLSAYYYLRKRPKTTNLTSKKL
jgi:hypothetical protein